MSRYVGVFSTALLLSAAAVQAEQMVVAIDGKAVSILGSNPD